jgi:hypothetical protein
MIIFKDENHKNDWENESIEGPDKCIDSDLNEWSFLNLSIQQDSSLISYNFNSTFFFILFLIFVKNNLQQWNLQLHN